MDDHNRVHIADQLTPRELEIVTLIASGQTNKEIADQLSIAEVTVRTHVSNILGKLHLVNRVQAALYALREGFVALDELDAEGGL